MDSNKVSVPAILMHARSLSLPSDDPHTNRMPFSGVLTRIDEPSDAAPEGSSGKRVMLTIDAARKAIDSLLLMGVNYNPEGHSPREKVGVITAANINGNAITISGYIYAADFPDVAAEIKANKSNLGMSFEARDLLTNDPHADPLPIVECTFTGAAILLKDNAAYRTTSINASTKEFKMKSKHSAIISSLQKHAPDLEDTVHERIARGLMADGVVDGNGGPVHAVASNDSVFALISPMRANSDPRNWAEMKNIKAAAAKIGYSLDLNSNKPVDLDELNAACSKHISENRHINVAAITGQLKNRMYHLGLIDK